MGKTEDDLRVLETLNVAIGEAENRGDVQWLTNVLAPRLAFRRADPQRTVDDRDGFLHKVKSGGSRVTRIAGPIELYGDRAIVKCIVRAGDREFHNLRLFIRLQGEWKLLGWANEPMTNPEPDAPRRPSDTSVQSLNTEAKEDLEI